MPYISSEETDFDPSKFNLAEGEQALNISDPFIDTVAQALKKMASSQGKLNLDFIQANPVKPLLLEISQALSETLQNSSNNLESCYISEDYTEPPPGQAHGRRIRLTTTDEQGHKTLLSIDTNSATRTVSSIDTITPKNRQRMEETPASQASDRAADTPKQFNIKLSKRLDRGEETKTVKLTVDPFLDQIVISDTLASKSHPEPITIRPSKNPDDSVPQVVAHLMKGHKAFYRALESKL